MDQPSVNSCVKCALSSLGCSRKLREAIDELAVRMQKIAVRGTHLANHIIVDSIQKSGGLHAPLVDLPLVLEASWWQKCFKASAQPQGRPRQHDGDEFLPHARTLFSGMEPIMLGKAATHAIETLSADIVTNIRVMLILNFHKQLRKAFRRDVLYWGGIKERLFEARDREALVDYCVNRCAQEGTIFKEREFPTGEPPELRIFLDAQVSHWKLLYMGVLPCPVPEFVSNLKGASVPLLFQWFVDLQRHRRFRQLQLTEALQGDAEGARRCFGTSAKAMRALPLAKLQVGHVAVDKTALKFLLLELRRLGEEISDLEIPNQTPVVIPRDENGEPIPKKAKKNDDGTDKATRYRRTRAEEEAQTQLFWSHFPGAMRLLRGRRGSKLHPFLRTDGISCSVALILPDRPETRAEIKALKRVQNACDLMPGNPVPIARQPWQRLVSIDPGRRDMIYGLAEEGGETSVMSNFKVSTRQHLREAKRARAREATIKLQKRTMIHAEVYRSQDLQADLHSTLCHLPSNKAFETYGDYERSMIPILEEAVSAMSARRLRRESFFSFQSKDRAIDTVCRKICGGRWTPPKARMIRPLVLVAFGNGGKVSTTGCGYAPAPQARLRHRLVHVWNARVSLINEYNTSKRCATCGELLREVFKTKNKGMTLKTPVKIHGILRCVDKLRKHERGSVFLHRDKNAAINIMRIYKALACGEERPPELRPDRGSRFS